MAAKVEFPFTYAQWKELERQAMIYKYMMECLPVPPHLLFSTSATTNFIAEANACHRISSYGGSVYSLRGYSNNKDSEPWRCKRSDGKKWRCSRDVAPNHKYCHRHLHRGRPRSRKLVELHHPLNPNNTNKTNKKTRDIDVAPIKSPAHQMQEIAFQPNGAYPVLSETNTDLTIKTFTNRDLEWMVEDKMLGIEGVEQQWPHLVESRIALASDGLIYDGNAPLFQQDYGGEPLDLFSYTDLAAPGNVQRNFECQFFVNSDVISLDNQPQTDHHPRGFIDAWSNDFNFKSTHMTNESHVSSAGVELSPCSLTLSMAMAADNALDEKMGDIQKTSVKDITEIEAKDSSYSCSWVPFTRGGPLAEVLHTGTVATGSSPASPCLNNGDLIGTPANSVSSSSGLNLRALLSQSDASICNSPILHLLP